ncbi:type II toxin-antitoxin system RelE/ParE family toxin [Candidatus Woesearchaeota archaeon]|nr:type II toxin-antitoxin system RelE/ParE family toxin [Candidatus Woesearchaeota archaeon]
MYTVEFSQTAEKQFLKLEKGMQGRIISTLERIKLRPHAHAKKLSGVPEYSLRVGDYRVILDIQDDKLVILVIKVGHRKNVYGAS